MLSAGTTGTIGIDSDIIIIDFHIQIFLNIRHDITGYKGGLALARRIERGNAYQSVYTLFGFQVAVCVLSVYLKCDGLDSRLITV